MTTDINPKGYAVVFFDGDVPKICNGMANGTVVDGKSYAIYDTVDAAVTEFKRWPHDCWNYGILPMSMLVEERPAYVLKDSAKDD